MKVLVAPDKFKGSLTGGQAADAIAAGVAEAMPDAEVIRLPIADGGEGTVDAAVAAGFERRTATVSGPSGEPVEAAYAVRGDVAVVELAQASGLSLVSGPMLAGSRSPLTATSRGTGELLLDAARAGASTVVLGLGGSACTDGGAGMLAALGVRFLDADGDVLPDGGGSLRRLSAVDTRGLQNPFAELELASDVDNPLLGPEGAAAVYGPQKGARGSDVDILEDGLRRLADVLDAHDVAEQPGAGAAGGVGFGAMARLTATRRPGFDVIADLIGLDAALNDADLVITGEGRIDGQSLRGKAPIALAHRARAHGVEVIALCGSRGVNKLRLERHGITACRALTELAPDTRTAMRNAADLLKRLAVDEIRRYADPAQ